MTNSKLNYIFFALATISLPFRKEFDSELERIKSQPPPNVIEFKKDSVSLDQKGCKTVDRLVKFMIVLTKYDSKPTFDKRDTSLYSHKVNIKLSPVCCKEEYSRNPFIGVQRASVIAGYIESKFSIPKSEIIIIDRNCKIDDHELCSITGIYLDLIKQ